jgi:hypothetical protein
MSIISNPAAGGGGGNLTVAVSTITGGTNKKILYDNSGVLGETGINYNSSNDALGFSIATPDASIDIRGNSFTTSTTLAKSLRMGLFAGTTPRLLWDNGTITWYQDITGGGGSDWRVVYNNSLEVLSVNSTGDLTNQGNIISNGSGNSTLAAISGKVGIGLGSGVSPSGTLDVKGASNGVPHISQARAGVRIGLASGPIVLWDNATNTYYADTLGGTGSDFRIVNNNATIPINLVQASDEVQISHSITVNSPTGGDKGAGTINVQAGVFLNGTAYTNPRWVLHHHYRGHVDEKGPYKPPAAYNGLPSIAEAEEHCRTKYELPTMLMLDGKQDLFAGSDLSHAALEQAYLYIFQLHRRIEELEARSKCSMMNRMKKIWRRLTN